MLYSLSRKRLRLSRETICVLALILIATLLRFILIYFHWPVTNSDEGNMGILARHVAYNGEWPIFFYGLPYLGPIEGYIAARDPPRPYDPLRAPVRCGPAALPTWRCRRSGRAI